MFTGIITDIGRIRAINPDREAAAASDATGDTHVVVETTWDASALVLGASIACAGVCLTVVDRGADWFAVDVSGETLACTTLAAWAPGSQINLERALRMGDELGGHIVSGHVDGVGEIVDVRADGDSCRIEITPPSPLLRLIAQKGSIAVDGVSLTVNEVGADRFGVNIIPHTQQMTSLGSAAPGVRVNLEVDMLARYVARLNETE
jgi:riboflavin synthase